MSMILAPVFFTLVYVMVPFDNSVEAFEPQNNIFKGINQNIQD